MNLSPLTINTFHEWKQINRRISLINKQEIQLWHHHWKGWEGTHNLQSRENCWAIISCEKLSRRKRRCPCCCSLRLSASSLHLGELFMPLFSSSLLLNNLVELSHCHYAKLYSFHYKYVWGVVETSHAEEGTSRGLSATITLLAPNCRHGSSELAM